MNYSLEHIIIKVNKNQKMQTLNQITLQKSKKQKQDQQFQKQAQVHLLNHQIKQQQIHDQIAI